MDGAFDPIAVVAGLIQTAIYADFGYIVSGVHITVSLYADVPLVRHESPARPKVRASRMRSTTESSDGRWGGLLVLQGSAGLHLLDPKSLA